MSINTNTRMQDRANEAAIRFLERRGYEILANGYECKFGNIAAVAKQDETIVFVDVTVGMDEDEAYDDSNHERRFFERVAACYLADCEFIDVQVRFDVIGVLVLDPDRAMLRHHINAFGVA